MPFTHRGVQISGNHVPLSRAAKRDIKALTEMSYGDTKNIPTEHLQAARERHGEAIIMPLLDSVNLHKNKMRQEQAKQAQRAETVNRIKTGIVNKVAPYRATAYEMGSNYGGPEEGGWWYDTADPVADSRPFLTRKGAQKAAEKMEQEYPSAPSSSGSHYDEESDTWIRGYKTTGYMGGDYQVDVQRGKGKPSPDRRPRWD